MPIRPPPLHCSCPSCRWSRTLQPLSDALHGGELPTECPACGHEPLRVERAGSVQALAARCQQEIARLFGR